MGVSTSLRGGMDGVGGGQYKPRGGGTNRHDPTRGHPDLVAKTEIPDEVFTTRVTDIFWTASSVGNPRHSNRYILWEIIWSVNIYPEILYIIIAFSLFAFKYYNSGMNGTLLSGQL